MRGDIVTGMVASVLRLPWRQRQPDLDPATERLVQESRQRAQRQLTARERLAYSSLGAAFLSAAVPLAVLSDSNRSPTALTVVLLVVAYAVASRIEFEVGPGTVVPTMLAVVPMLFILPVGVVPLCVAGGLLAGQLPDYVLGRVHVERALLLPASSWHSIGPALVLVIAGEGPPRLSDWAIYAGALGAQFALDFVNAVVAEWIAFGAASVAVSSMAVVFGVDATLAPIGLLAALAGQQHALYFLLVLPLVGLLGVFAHQRRASFDRAFELGRAYRGTAFLLGDVVEANDSYTGEHSREVVELVLEVCDALGVDERQRRDAELAALLHDVGKIRVPREIITKPAALTAAERALMDTHTIEGEEMLGKVGGLLGGVGEIVRSCHEHWDGTGYPDGLRSDQIPLVARIVTACDAWSAMTSDRPYRVALPHDRAIAELRYQAGRQFDPDVVDALVGVLERELVAV